MLGTATVHHAPGSDAILAATAGPMVWSTEDRPRSLAESVALAGCAMALLGQLITVVGLATWNPGDIPTVALLIGCIGCVTTIGAAGLYLSFVASRRHVNVSTAGAIATRCVAVALFAVGWGVVAPGIAAALVWPLGAYAGFEYSITTAMVGSDRSVRSLLVGIVRSPLHAGAVVALLLAAIVDGGGWANMPVELAIALEVVVLAAATTYGAMNILKAAERERIEQERVNAQAGERRRRAHWIHDDVCADIRSIRIKVATRDMSLHDVADELDELDYRMRLRQLDEILEEGAVSAAEFLQPYLRRVQNAGVRLVNVPRFEDASIEVPTATAHVLRRATAGLISNAVAAGCTSLSIRLSHHPGGICVSVEDDAGGFELASIPAGRGLSSIAQDVGHENLSVERGAEGAIVIVNIPLEERT